MEKKGILTVSFGTSHLDTLEKTITQIEKEISLAFPEFQIYRAFTSGMILRKLKKNQIEIHDVRGALEQMEADGIRQVIVQPTHVIHGSEYDKMMDQLNEFKDRFDTIRAGVPLLSAVEDYKKAIHTIMTEVEVQEDEMLVLMGHGSEHPANSSYALLEYMFHFLGYENVLVGTVEGFPDLEAVKKKMSTSGLKKIVLLPFMIVAGDHAKNDMDGDEDSWKNEFIHAGYETRTILQGLGEFPGIRRIFLEHMQAVM